MSNLIEKRFTIMIKYSYIQKLFIYGGEKCEKTVS